MDEKGSKLVVLERDRKIIREIDRWRVCLGRHIGELVGFSGQRACDRRLRKLVQAGYIRRERVLYGVAGIYRITSKGAKLEGLGNAKNKIRIEQIRHDIAVLDTAIYFNKVHGIEYRNIRTEIELHRIDGFGIRKHRPDFVFTQEKKTTCVEIELALKSKNRFENIISNNFMDYDRQIWIVPDLECKIAKTLQKNKTMYANIEIMALGQIQGTKENENDGNFTSPMESGQIDLDI
ncbi:MAG: hypothetical protein FWC92_06685 [Defluviitaleaceae bacterium]|nr:hypothetical protein [Defluviitaleaceae bacterium]